MEWKHPSPVSQKEIESDRSVGIVMAVVFWDSKVVLFIDCMERGIALIVTQY
jgi:hypothetical protein